MTAFVFLLLPLALGQQEEPASESRPGPPRDPKAWALLDGADALLRAPSADGLKDVTYTHRLHHLPGVAFRATWVAPDHGKAEVRLEETVAPATRVFVEQQEAALVAEIVRVIDVVVGMSNRRSYGGDAVSLAGERTVKVEARSEKSKARFRDVVITFDERGLPVRARHRTATGEVDMTATFKEHGKGRFIIDRVETAGPPGRSTTMRFTYGAHGPYLFVERIVADGPSGRVVQTFEDFQVDQGLKPP